MQQQPDKLRPQYLVFGIRLDADGVNIGVSRYLLDYLFDDCTHDFGFLQTNVEDLLMRDNRLRWVLNDLPFELNEHRKQQTELSE